MSVLTDNVMENYNDKHACHIFPDDDDEGSHAEDDGKTSSEENGQDPAPAPADGGVESVVETVDEEEG